jgi:hypothetical protein
MRMLRRRLSVTAVEYNRIAHLVAVAGRVGAGLGALGQPGGNCRAGQAVDMNGSGRSPDSVGYCRPLRENFPGASVSALLRDIVPGNGCTIVAGYFTRLFGDWSSWARRPFPPTLSPHPILSYNRAYQSKIVWQGR